MQLDDTILHKPSQELVFGKIQYKDLDIMVNEMFELVQANGGIGLAANQVNLDLRVFVIDYEGYQKVFFNPKIIDKSNKFAIMNEGCLSLPGVEVPVKRHKKIKVSYQDMNGKFHTEFLFGMKARIFQHELDHLDGITILDREVQNK